MKVFDLEERTFEFARDVRLFVKTLPRTIANEEDIKQVVRSSGSVGSNYREANDALSKKDFVFRLRVSRKEAKESKYWLRLIHATNDLQNEAEALRLIQEADELKKILSKMVTNSGG